jgi:hypothetical protein
MESKDEFNNNIPLQPLLDQKKTDSSGEEEPSLPTAWHNNLPYKKILGCVGVMLLAASAGTGAYYAYQYKDVLHQGFFFENGQTAGGLWTILVLTTIALAISIHNWVNSDKKKEEVKMGKEHEVTAIQQVNCCVQKK